MSGEYLPPGIQRLQPLRADSVAEAMSANRGLSLGSKAVTSDSGKSARLTFERILSRSVFPWMQLSDRDLMLSINANNVEGAVAALETVGYYAHNIRFVQGTNERDATLIDAMDLPLGETYHVGDFFDRTLRIDEILEILSNIKRRPGNYSDIVSEIIPSLLSKPIEIINIDLQRLNFSRNIVNNVLLFKRWMLDSFGNGQADRVIPYLSFFGVAEAGHLGVSLGSAFAHEYHAFTRPLRAALARSSDQHARSQINELYAGAIIEMRRNLGGYPGFQDRVTLSSGIEGELNPEVSQYTFIYSNEEAISNYRDIQTLINKTKRITIDADDSLFLERLGVEKITIEPGESPDRQQPNYLVLTTDFRDETQVTLSFDGKPASDPEWIQRLAIEYGIKLSTAQNLATYLFGLIVDLARFERIEHFSRHTEFIDGLVIPNKLMRQIGVRGLNVLEVEQQYPSPFVQGDYSITATQEPQKSLLWQGRCIYDPSSRYFADNIDPDTAEVSRTDIEYARGRFYPLIRLQETSIELVTPEVEGALVFNSRNVAPKVLPRDVAKRATFLAELEKINTLDVHRDWHALYDLLSRYSITYALESVALYNL